MPQGEGRAEESPFLSRHGTVSAREAACGQDGPHLILRLGVCTHGEQVLHSLLLACLSCLMQSRLPIILDSLQENQQLTAARQA